MPSSHKWQRHLLLGFLAVLIFVAVGGFSLVLWVQSYLRGEPFRKLISQKTSVFLKVDGDYSPLHWSGLSVYSDSFTAQGRAGSMFTDLRAEQLQAKFNLVGLFQRTWLIDQLQLQHVDGTIDAYIPSPHQEHLAEESTTPVHSWMPDHVDLRRVIIQETNLKWAGCLTGEMSRVHLTITDKDQMWNIDGEGGRFLQTGWPILNINQIKSSYRWPQLFVTDGLFQVNNQGDLHANGEVRLDQNPQFHFNLRFSDIPITPFLAEDWRARFTGNLLGEIQVKGALNSSESIEATGSLTLANGRLEALPILEKISLFSRTQQFRQIVLHRASADFSWEQSTLTVTQFLAEAKDLLKIQGSFVVKQRLIDGTFRVGVTPSSLQYLPGAQSKVFTVQENGYLWTMMRVTGPIEHPKEDLTPRLMTAAGDTVVESVKKTVEKHANEILDFLKPSIH